jgi:hypothetical protein
MEFIERLPLNKLHYLKSLSFKEYKQYDKSSSKNEEERKQNYEKMRRFADNFIKANGEIKRLYKFTGGNNWGENSNGSGRLFADGCGIQGLPKKIRGFLLDGITTDIDMVNAHPVILRYLCRKHNLKHDELDFYIENRDEVLSQFTDRETGKTLFLKATNDEKLNKKETNPIFKAYDKEMKETQKALTKLTCYENIVKDVPTNKLYNWYGSAMNRILCYYENNILQIIITELNKKQIEICAPMFDGALLYGTLDNKLLSELENTINNFFQNLNMKLSYKEHSNAIIMPSDFVIAEKPTAVENDVKIANNDNDACKIIFDELKHNFKSYKGRLFYLHEHVWIYDETFIDNYILNYILNSNIYYDFDETKDKFSPYCQNVTKAKHIREALYCEIKINNNDDDLYSKFHTTTKGKLIFNDGVLDFVSKCFLTWEQIQENKLELYTTTKINRNYKEYFESPNQTVINDIREKIFDTLYGDKTDKALHFLSRALAGHHEDKRWATYLGNRNCGKGVEYELLCEGFENYVSTFELGNMLYCRKTAGTENIDCSKKLYWLIDLEFVRLAVSQEVPDCNSGLQVNSKILKKVTGGGDEIVARRNYDRKDTHFKIDTSFYIKGNNTLVCDNVDCDETRLEFCSVVQFKTQEEIEIMKQQDRDEKEMVRYKVADVSIKDNCKTLEWKNAIVYLIYENYSQNCVEVERTIDVEDNSLLGTINELYELTNNKQNVILCSELHAELSTFDKGKIALELSAMNVFKKRETKGENKGKFVYMGIKTRSIRRSDKVTENQP